MLRRRQINADTEGRFPRSGFTIADAVRRPLERIAWALEQGLVWRVADLLHRVFDTVKWPFERLIWVTQRRLIWPLQERAADMSHPSRAAGAVVAVATGIGLLAVLLTSGSTPERVRVAVPVRVAVTPTPPPPPATTTTAPVLQGVPPSFGSAKDTTATTTTDGAKTEASKETTATASAETTTSGTNEEAEATASQAKPVPAGPVAMKVARRFAEAFVFYEIGERQARARTVFGETATPRLANALGERPPRLPQNTKVPQARVLNLVPGPRLGKAYTVSVSLLRVGVTSELRLELKKIRGAWLVTDVRG